MENEKKKRSPRRTKVQLEKDILQAIERLVVKKGFVNIPVINLIQEAGIDPSIFYRRYQTVGDVYAELVKKNDFWINDSVRLSDLQTMGDERFYAEYLKVLRKELSDNRVMQRMLLWELSESNEITRRTSQFRDTLYVGLMAHYKRFFDPAQVNILPISAILISGIYYLTLHGSISEFCSIDFGTDEGKQALDSAIDDITKIIFSHVEWSQERKRMATEMLADGISEKKVCRYMGIGLVELRKIVGPMRNVSVD